MARSKKQEQLYVAATSGSAHVEGEGDVSFVRDRTIVDGNDPLYRQASAHFKPLELMVRRYPGQGVEDAESPPERERGVEQATAAPGEKRGTSASGGR